MIKEKDLLPAIAGKPSDIFYGKVNAWIKIKKRGLADLYERKEGKLVKSGTLVFNPLLPKFKNAYIIMKSEHSLLAQKEYHYNPHSVQTQFKKGHGKPVPRLCPHGVLGVKKCRKCHPETEKKNRNTPLRKESQRKWEKLPRTMAVRKSYQIRKNRLRFKRMKAILWASKNLLDALNNANGRNLAGEEMEQLQHALDVYKKGGYKKEVKI